MATVVLRMIRRILRRLDAVLDPAERYTGTHHPPPTNGHEQSIADFLASLDIDDPAAAAYLDEHRERLVRSLSLVPLGSENGSVLELGSYLHMAAALERVLGYGRVRAAYYSASPGQDSKSLQITGQEPYAAEVDLFDAELHRYPYPDSSFDVVMCCEVLEHLVHDPMHMFVECWRVLAGGGTAPHHTECGESHKSFRGHGRKAQPTGFLALSPAGEQ